MNRPVDARTCVEFDLNRHSPVHPLDLAVKVGGGRGHSVRDVRLDRASALLLLLSCASVARAFVDFCGQALDHSCGRNIGRRESEISLERTVTCDGVKPSNIGFFPQNLAAELMDKARRAASLAADHRAPLRGRCRASLRDKSTLLWRIFPYPRHQAPRASSALRRASRHLDPSPFRRPRMLAMSNSMRSNTTQERQRRPIDPRTSDAIPAARSPHINDDASVTISRLPAFR